jgi:hypothetical protein
VRAHVAASPRHPETRHYTGDGVFTVAGQDHPPPGDVSTRDAVEAPGTSLPVARCRARGNMEAIMPLLLVPVLWIGGSAILLGGGYYLISNVLVR